MDPGVAVRRVGGIELAAAADPAHVRTGADRVVDRKSEITGDAEDVLDADCAQPGKNMFDDRLAHDLILPPLQVTS